VITGIGSNAPRARLLASLAALSLAACGGGGSDSDDPTLPVQQPGANAAPTIAGTPATTVNVGSTYTFTPTGADADNDTLTYSIQNQPSWTTFTANNGRLTGTPTAVGTFSNIRISVSDGKTTTQLAAFNITVNQSGGTGTGAVTLDWTAPTENDDGSVFNNIGGYRILYGTSAGSLNRSVNLTNPSLTSYVVENLASGTWYFAIKVYNTSNVESIATNAVSAVVP
jgi:hypothetical protein